MKTNKKTLFLIFVFCCLFYPAVVFATSDIGGGGSGGAGTGNTKDGMIASLHDIGLRVTIYEESGKRVSNSADVVFSQNVYDRFRKYGSAYNTLNASNRSKVDYINGSNVTWEYSNLEGKIIVEQNQSSEDASAPSGDFPGNLLKDNALYWYNNIDIKNKKYVPVNVMNKLQACTGNYHCEYGKKYYAVIEPTFYLWFNNKRYYGTAYELAYEIMSNDKSSAVKSGGSRLNGWVNKKIPRTLVISGNYKTFYQNIGITEYCSNWETCFSTGKSNFLTKETILKKGVGMSVYDWTEILKTQEDITCGVDVSIGECGESSIYEAMYNGATNKKECIVDNAAYSYIDGCNLYCSDEITTDFNGFYGNFKGNNVFGAIRSGKYLAIKSNPKITIKKTCYQSKSSNECPDVSGSFRNKLNSDYRTNKIYLNIDGKKYEFIGNSTISNNGYSSATIIYEYKLDENVNKYIDIETMKGILNPNDKTYTNEGPTIITSKGTYGSYTYNFDVSETPLNKYTSSSSALRKLKNTRSDRYNFTNSIVINYTGVSGNKKNNYTNDDLKNTTCTYVKYNQDQGCICPANECCDSVTCEVLDECTSILLPPPGGDCTCTGTYGCYDDGKCTPILLPPPGDNDGDCDPDKKVCFPNNIIYRPISLVEPFPGINGNNRIPGNNWNKVIKTSNGKVYSYGDYYIRNRRGYKDYEIYQAEPLYVIKLDGTKIQAIRKYNDKHNYNDFELTCINGENCISKFLRGATQDFSINLIDSGTCKNINNDNFNSCIKNKGE